MYMKMKNPENLIKAPSVCGDEANRNVKCEIIEVHRLSTTFQIDLKVLAQFHGSSYRLRSLFSTNCASAEFLH